MAADSDHEYQQLRAEIQKKLIDTDFEQWFPLVDPEDTAPTLFYPITREIAETILNANRSLGSTSLEADRIADLTPLNDYEAKLFAMVAGGLQKKIDVFGPSFIKTSSMSPKDVVLLLPSFKTNYSNNYRTEREKRGWNDMNKNEQNQTKLLAFMDACTLCLQFSNAKEALRAFVLSQRTAEGMERALTHEEYGNFIIRKWMPAPLDSEFRLFVHDNVLRGASQYIDSYFSKRIFHHRDHVAAAITKFFHDKLGPRLHSTFYHYAVDICIPDLSSYITDTDLIVPVDQWELKVIEVNPWFESTGMCLFSGRAEEELEEKEGRQFPIVKVQDKLVSLGFMSKDWREAMYRVEAEVEAETK
ncbi:hypothetical protein PROFUN_11647 [Planoprotostelium fungivorum]|uniref:Cell division cycle protein 123 n=1 Tax=Planoprotostelium fungivorum TaxID=1890364 RepID=A0A2P6N9P8_9EUKA|nr:hypothetical protein PROFUN_11647 [Planoprotostelium fungivorum]